MGSSISELLDDLQKIPEGDQEKLKAWCDSLCKFYELNVRHSYADITEYIISHDGGVEYTEKILPVLEKMRENLKQEKTWSSPMSESLSIISDLKFSGSDI